MDCVSDLKDLPTPESIQMTDFVDKPNKGKPKVKSIVSPSKNSS